MNTNAIVTITSLFIVFSSSISLTDSSIKIQKQKNTNQLEKKEALLEKKDTKLQKIINNDKNEQKQQKLSQKTDELKQEITTLNKKKESLELAHWELPNKQLRLDQISVLGAHNALESEEDGWIYAQQKWGLNRLLNEGVRALEIDLGTMAGMDVVQENKHHLYICHATCEESRVQKTGGIQGKFASFKGKMKQLAKWLHEHPTEVVFLMTDFFRDPSIKENQIDSELETLDTVKTLILRPQDWDPEAHNGNWPTLQWMNDHKKQIVIFNQKYKDSPIYTFFIYKYVGVTEASSGDAAIYTKLDSASRKFYTGNPELQKKIQRFLQLDLSPDIATKDAKKVVQFNVQAKSTIKKAFNTKTSEKEALKKAAQRKEEGKASKDPSMKELIEISRIYDNKRSTIAPIVQNLKAANVMGGRNPSFLMLNFSDKFVNDRGLIMINEWNQEAAKNLSPEAPTNPTT